MRAAVTTGEGILVREVPQPVPGPGQVLVAPLATGICGSDLHAAEGMRAAGADAPPIVMGHEFCARVVAYGPDCVERVSIGDRVVAIPYAAGQLLGLNPVLPGGFAERMVVDEQVLLPVPDGLSDEAAALTEPLAVGVHAAAAGALEPGRTALVIGCGPIGLAVIAALKGRGHAPVVAADLSPVRRRAAERLGADVVVDPAVTSPYEGLGPAERAAAPMFDEDGTPDVVAFECVGVPGLLQQVIEGVPRHTRIVVVGVCMVPDTIQPLMAVTKELSMSFVFGYRRAEFAEALAMLADGRVPPGPMITGHTDLDGVAKAFAELANPDHQVKIIVRP